jgi:hypothetical protein
VCVCVCVFLYVCVCVCVCASLVSERKRVYVNAYVNAHVPTYFNLGVSGDVCDG